MNKIMIFVLFGLLTSFIQTEKKHTLTIEIRGIKKAEGKVMVGVFRKKDDFPKMKGNYKYVIVSAKSPAVEIQIDLPSDTYAVGVFHDANSNGYMDKNIVGYPTEIYGFSRNARGKFSSPDFEQAAFELKNDRKISIDVL